MAAYACLARDAGARLIGGCCGTTARHVRAMADALATTKKGETPGYDKIERLLGPIRKVTTKPTKAQPARAARVS
jgi:5-methyltetrahydrofolate--homocysteine methyltransferase